jgi:hypothetical protein
MKQFSIDKLETAEDQEINSLIMEEASDIAEELTELECEVIGIDCYCGDDQELMFTDEAQDIFNIHYDSKVDELYNLVNLVLKTVNK